jgi:predicted amidohydrolase
MIATNQAYGSGSMIADERAQILQHCPDKAESYITATLDLNRVRQRRAYSRNFQQRRPELYKRLTDPIEAGY